VWRAYGDGVALPTTEHENREIEHPCSIPSSPWTIFGSSNPADKTEERVTRRLENDPWTGLHRFWGEWGDFHGELKSQRR
jgi:hypothetical protein